MNAISPGDNFFPSTNIDSEALSIHLRLWSISALHAETAVEYSPGSLVTFSIVFVWVHVCTVFTHMDLCWYYVETYSGLFSIFPQLFPSDLWSDRWIKNCLHYYLDFSNLPCISFCFLYILGGVALCIKCTVRCESISSLQAVHRSQNTELWTHIYWSYATPCIFYHLSKHNSKPNQIITINKKVNSNNIYRNLPSTRILQSSKSTRLKNSVSLYLIWLQSMTIQRWRETTSLNLKIIV